MEIEVNRTAHVQIFTLFLIIFCIFGIKALDPPAYVGCVLDQHNRTLPFFQMRIDAMTNDFCADHCCTKSVSMTYMGTQDATECYCGNQSDTRTFVFKPLEDCDRTCGGNESQICGGVWRISVYTVDCFDMSTAIDLRQLTQHEQVTTSSEDTTVPLTYNACLDLFHSMLPNVTLSKDQLQNRLIYLRNAISIDKENTTLYKNKKRSAADSRTSSRNIGIVGVIVLVLPLFLVVGNDLSNLRPKKRNKTIH